MDIFNRTPSISEDTVQYILYPPSNQLDRSSVTTYATCMRIFVESLLPGFLWHRDPFELKVVSDPDGQGWVLEGRMRVGDCVDDEWCLVWLLKEISAKWDVAISVFDTDGEFLLIEAAECLPAWVKPSNSENRVWIYGSRFHLVSISHVSPPSRKRRRRQIRDDQHPSDDEVENVEEDKFIAAQDALELVRNPSIDTFAPMEVEKIVWKRISGYPSTLKEHVHVTKAYLPVDVAKALSTDPSLVQKAVETFYTRDAIQLRAVHRMARFPPQPSILRTVKMTRTAYAQLLGQRFHPPKIYGTWKEHEGTPEWRWRDVGMKIACGFEILFQESKNRTSFINVDAKSSAEARKEGLRHNPDYAQYISNLFSLNYFRGELEGSQLWTTLEDKATDLFVEVRRTDNTSRQSFATLVSMAMSHAADTLVDEKEEAEDSDDWLNVDADGFEDMLEKTMGVPKDDVPPRDSPSSPMLVDQPNGQNSVEDRVANEQASKLRKLAQKVEDFVEGEGDLEGAMFEDEASSGDEFSDEESSDEAEARPMNDEDRQSAMAKLVPGLEPSEYGQMPASFHSHSQKVVPTTLQTGVEEVEPEATTEPSRKPIREPILPRDDFDGVVSDEDTDEDATGEDGESEEEQPQVVGEIEVDMAEEEEEFLEFSRQALGITDEQWKDIVRDRQKRGAFLPTSATPSVHTARHAMKTENTAKSPQRDAKPQNANSSLNSFEAVMQAMDAELARQKHGPKTTPSRPQAQGKGKGKADAAVPDEMQSIEAAMEAEFRELLERGDENEEADDEPMDYNLIKNFLESFKSQGGLAGPVSSLAGRLEPNWRLPRDDAY